MLIDLLVDILAEYRSGITIHQFRDILKEKNIRLSAQSLFDQSDYFYLSNDVVFLKTALKKSRDHFFQDFKEYLQVRAYKPSHQEDILNGLQNHISDLLFTEWFEISLEARLLIFDLLLTFFIVPKNKVIKIKKHFSDLVNLYSVIIIYSQLIVQSLGDDFDEVFEFIQSIEPYEEKLKEQLFNILTHPDLMKKKLNPWYQEYQSIVFNTEKIFAAYFKQRFHNSEILLKRVFQNELEAFDFSLILTRFSTSTYYEWLLILQESGDDYPHPPVDYHYQ
ncbi:MAG: hypothetical protein MJB14_07485 [Spirochaetes bacterium]|nr:hypothetical protein [Spirochaetota bacterium]